MHASRRIALRHLLVNDATARCHPLHIAGTDDAAVAHAVAMRHGPRQHVSDRLDSPVRMPREAGQIVLRNVVTEIVQQEKRIEVFCVSKAERPAKMDSRTFERRFRFDKPPDGSDRHIELQCTAVNGF